MLKKFLAIVCLLSCVTIVFAEKARPKIIEASLPSTVVTSDWKSVIDVTNFTMNGVSYGAKKYDIANLEPSALMADQAAYADVIAQYDSTAAFKAAAALTISANPSPDGSADVNANTTRRVDTIWGRQVASPKIVIPAGIYFLTDEIVLGPGTTIESDGKVEIVQLNPLKRTFVFRTFYDVKITGIRFTGGTNALWFENKNVDGTLVTIRDCWFMGTVALPIPVGSQRSLADLSGFAVVAVPPPTISPTGIPTWGPLSAAITLDGCKWMGCYAAWASAADTFSVRGNSWVQWYTRLPSDATPDLLDVSPDPFNEFCVLNLRGRMDLEKTDFIPNFDTSKPEKLGRDPSKHAWIKNWGSVSATNCKFGGEFAGIRIIIHVGFPSLFDPRAGQSISFINCQLSAGPAAVDNSAVITLVGFPRSITIDNCNNLYLAGKSMLIRADAGLLQNINAMTHPLDPSSGWNETSLDALTINLRGNACWPYTALKRENLSRTMPDFLVPCVNRGY